jgi:hypothetical protein
MQEVCDGRPAILSRNIPCVASFFRTHAKNAFNSPNLGTKAARKSCSFHPRALRCNQGPFPPVDRLRNFGIRHLLKTDFESGKLTGHRVAQLLHKMLPDGSC